MSLILRSLAILAALALLHVPGADAGSDCLTIAFQGNVAGKVEDCGCPKRPLGGLAHRAKILGDLSQSCTNTIVVDAGNLLGAPGLEGGEAQNRFLAAESAAMGYDVMGIGRRDLAFGLDFARDLQSQHGITLVSTNLVQDGEPVFAPHHVKEIAGVRVGFLSVTAPDTRFTDLGLETLPAKEAVLAGLAELDADVVVLLANLDRGKTQQLLLELPADHGIDFAIEGQTGSHFKEPKTVNGAQLVAANRQGKYIGELRLTIADGEYLDDFAHELHAVDIKGPKDDAMAQRLDEYLRERERLAGSR